LHNYLDNTAVFAVEGTKNLGASILFKSAAKIGNG
jgi:heme oxygenase